MLTSVKNNCIINISMNTRGIGGGFVFGRVIDLTGERFGRLVVMKRDIYRRGE